MSDKDCPDKLEPEQHILTSVLKNVPIELMWHLRNNYISKPSYYTIRWRARQPVEGKHYGKGGELKFEDAQSADMYVTDDTKHELMKKYLELKNKNADLKRDLDVLQYDYDGVVRFTEMHRDMDAKYEKLQDKHKESIDSFSNLQVGHRLLQTKYDDLLTDHMDGEEWKARHDDLLHQLESPLFNKEERGKDKEWTDDMSEQADKDYDAVTKGVISFINLLRR